MLELHYNIRQLRLTLKFQQQICILLRYLCSVVWLSSFRKCVSSKDVFAFAISIGTSYHSNQTVMKKYVELIGDGLRIIG